MFNIKSFIINSCGADSGHKILLILLILMDYGFLKNSCPYHKPILYRQTQQWQKTWGVIRWKHNSQTAGIYKVHPAERRNNNNKQQIPAKLAKIITVMSECLTSVTIRRPTRKHATHTTSRRSLRLRPVWRKQIWYGGDQALQIHKLQTETCIFFNNNDLWWRFCILTELRGVK